MRKIAFILLTLLLSSCVIERFSPDGQWEPIKLNKKELSFSAQGGVDTVIALNYNSWWITGAHEGTKHVQGELVYINYVEPESTSGHMVLNDTIDGGWYHAVVPDKSRSNRLIIKVDPNTSIIARKATIEMECGDAFTSIQITQDYSSR